MNAAVCLTESRALLSSYTSSSTSKSRLTGIQSPFNNESAFQFCQHHIRTLFLSQLYTVLFFTLYSFDATALPRQRIQLAFDKNYYMEPSFECRFDHIEIRDGPFGFSPLIDRFCGVKNPGLVTSTGRFMWIKFNSDEELEGLGFRIKYTFIAGECFAIVQRSWLKVLISLAPTLGSSILCK